MLGQEQLVAVGNCSPGGGVSALRSWAFAGSAWIVAATWAMSPCWLPAAAVSDRQWGPSDMAAP
eukprot:12725972-Alexandrium_andersonii.AAC.1